ncbi:MAG: hypothetical protein HOI95_02345, partial [Chromatiales bacterium]|nr:hypothetical protein [Chromatiales bacterium]
MTNARVISSNLTIAQTLGGFLADPSVEIPGESLTHAKMLIASTFASAACGVHIPSAQLIRSLECQRGGRPEASIWFHDETLPLASAGRVNAMMSDAAASDDSDLRNIVHVGTPLTAAGMAAAETIGANGKQLLVAMVLGYEAAGRIAASITPGFRQRGFHGCLGAIFASAVVTARLLQLDANQMAHTLALSATSIGGLMAAANTSVAREYHAGLATMLGIEAANAARLGFTAELGIFEADKGFCAAFGGTNGEGITDDLSDEWDIDTDMAIKLVPGGHHNHATAEAAGNAAREGNVDADDVEAIVVSRPGLEVLAEPIHPNDLIDMAHSLAYFAAAGVADHGFGWEHASTRKIADPVVHKLIDRVAIGPAPTEHRDDYRQGATVCVRTRSGRSFSNTVLIPKGAACLGIAWADVDEKFRTLMLANHSVIDVENALCKIRELDEASDVRQLL